MKLLKQKDMYYRDGKEISKATYYRLLGEEKKNEKVLRLSQDNKKRDQQTRTRQRSMEEKKSLIKFKWMLDNRKDKYILLDRLEEYKVGRGNSTYRLTKQCLKYLNKQKEDRKEIRIIINKELK